MADLRVKCINKISHDNPHEGITELGGDGWKSTRGEVITAINGGRNTYYTFEGGKRADVKVRVRNGNQYVQTQADGIWTNNLLDLHECK